MLKLCYIPKWFRSSVLAIIGQEVRGVGRTGRGYGNSLALTPDSRPPARSRGCSRFAQSVTRRGSWATRETRFGDTLDASRKRELLSMTDVDIRLTIGGLKGSECAQRRATDTVHAPQFTLKHFLLLVAVVAILIGVFSLSTASRADLGHQAGSHLRSLARAHRLGESDGPANRVEHSAVRPTALVAEVVLLGRLLPTENDVRKPFTALPGSRIPRAPPARATA